MKILTTQYTISKKSLDIYTAGCKSPHCKGCFNPETWNFNQGTSWKKFLKNIDLKFKNFDNMIDRIMIFGGEPLDNDPKDVIEFLNYLKKFDREIWLFTRYYFDEIPIKIKELCNYIKCGRYEEEKKVDNYFEYDMMLATSNQKIYKII